MSEDTREKFIVFITGINSEKAFGPFFSIQDVWEILKSLGFERKSDTWWNKRIINAYIKPLLEPGKIKDI